MKMPALLNRSGREMPGVSGVARVDRQTEALLRRVGVGEIAVIDQIDLDRVTADALVAAQVKAVVNAAPSISGRFPNLGPAALIAAGVTLVDGIGDEAFRRIRDGAHLRLHDGAVLLGDELLGRGVQQTEESVTDAMHAAKEGLANQLEAFSANTIEFMRRDRALLLDGIGVPDVHVPLRGQHVLVVAPGTDHEADLHALRRYIKEYHPVLVGVGAGADALRRHGHQLDLIVGDPAEVSDDALTSGADVVVPAFADGHAPGLHRVQDLGAGAVTFPASANAEDLALLLAHYHGAHLIVTVGFQATLAEFLDGGRSGSNASTFLTRLKVGNMLVDSKVVAALYRNPVSLGAALLLVGAVLVAIVAALMVTSVGPVILAHLQQAGSWLVHLVRGWSR
ncbi:MAG TPA: putative cytokinetic ring protein SteA [Pseudonocardia sp.]|jgi:uncharacterized membrane-anchored protein|uniref:putative cytokinetic ring protein SteA n=1 Tax=Pseudonocardia sp. TaxID=60912 RepID=UPI002F3E4256